jgi:sugar (pentulose or hexulose) kinase
MRSHAMNSITKIRYIRDVHPEIFEKTYKFITYAEFIAMKLCGECVIDTTMASRSMAYDLKTNQWDESLLSFAGISSFQLGTIQESATVIGQLSADIAKEAGLQGKPLVCTGGHDQCCAALGAGVVSPSMGVVSTGTAEVISTCLPAIVTNDGMFESYFPCYRYVMSNTYFTFSLNHVGGILLRWFKDTFCAKEVEQARLRGMSVYHYLDQIMARKPQELFIVPHFNGSGTPWCDMQATGAIVGLRLSTGIAELYRALLESQTYELALNLEAFAKAGISIDTLSAVGGGSKSSEWVQIKANILNRPVKVPVCNESASLGAAILAGSAVGVWKDAREGANHMVGFRKEYEPQADMTRLYGDLLAHYREIYPMLRKLREEK